MFRASLASARRDPGAGCASSGAAPAIAGGDPEGVRVACGGPPAAVVGAVGDGIERGRGR